MNLDPGIFSRSSGRRFARQGTLLGTDGRPRLTSLAARGCAGAAPQSSLDETQHRFEHPRFEARQFG